MSTEYEAVIAVGLPRNEILNQDLIDDSDLQSFAPYYDGNGADYAIVGLIYCKSGAFSTEELTWDPVEIEKLKSKFKKLTNQDAKVWLTNNSW